MSLTTLDLSTPHTEKTLPKVIGHIENSKSQQLTAATSTGDFIWQATFDGVLGDAEVSFYGTPASGESMVYDIQKNGTTVLSSTLTISSTTSGKTQSFKSVFAPGSIHFVKGDVFTINRTYTAGGTPTPVAHNVVTLYPSIKRY